MASDLETRVVRLESQMEHVATKEDIARLEGSIKVDAAERETRMVKRFVGSVAVVGGLASGLTALLMRLV